MSVLETEQDDQKLDQFDELSNQAKPRIGLGAIVAHLLPPLFRGCNSVSIWPSAVSARPVR